ncbi:alpha/beta fold hydrolase [Streptomyces sp. NPDC087844]|uniref:alpha/beta fold hydrolase n=1 Tax=Streptomyces sp. NPDC087844 TaxID=3365805 RepID=UPI0037F5D6F4
MEGIDTAGRTEPPATAPVTGSAIPEHISVWAELAALDHTVRHVDVRLSGRSVRTRVLQAGAGPELVLLHGTGGHLEAYARDIAGLAQDFHVTAYDMVGHGWSDLPDLPYTIDVLTEHLVSLLDVLEIERAHLSGESLGGWVAAWFAAHHPERIARLVLNTPGNIANKPEVMARLRDSTLAAVRDPSDSTVRRRVEFLFHHKEMVTDELVNLRRQIYSRPGYIDAVANTLVLQDPEVRRRFAWDSAWVSRVTAPTLLLWTSHDPTGGLDEAHMLLDWLPDAHLHVIDDAGHWPQWEKPEQFLTAHRDWLRRGSPKSPESSESPEGLGRKQS